MVAQMVRQQAARGQDSGLVASSSKWTRANVYNIIERANWWDGRTSVPSYSLPPTFMIHPTLQTESLRLSEV